MAGGAEEPGDDAERSDSRDNQASGEGSGIPATDLGASEGRGSGRREGATGSGALSTPPDGGAETRNRINLYPASSWTREVAAKDEAAGHTRWRHPTARDYARVLHSPSFRRLGGKTQVFPINESDFFRTRLTHSLEVSQIAEGIAQYLNEKPEFEFDKINERLCVTASLMHDLGHPPFGHNGERALDDAMRGFGGFEGNAQTIRIITRIEKKARKEPAEDCSIEELCDRDERAGLSLTYRTILSALKYDHVIDGVRDQRDDLQKGYYKTEAHIIERAKSAIDPDWRSRGDFKTVECSIMDVADDIAYSTYDLEDCLKAGFLTPADIFAANDSLFNEVAKKANKALKKRGLEIDAEEAQKVFFGVFPVFDDPRFKGKHFDEDNFVYAYRVMKNISSDGYDRTSISSSLVNSAIMGIEYQYNDNAPWLTEVRLSDKMLKRVEVLKHFTFQSVIHSARVKVGEYRGYEVVSNIFKALSHPKGEVLMPDDLRKICRDYEHDATARNRAICDFVAGMTDRYALEFHARLHSDDPQSIFKSV